MISNSFTTKLNECRTFVDESQSHWYSSPKVKICICRCKHALCVGFLGIENNLVLVQTCKLDGTEHLYCFNSISHGF